VREAESGSFKVLAVRDATRAEYGEAHGNDSFDDRLTFGLQIIFAGSCSEPLEQVIYEFKQCVVLALKRVNHQPDLIRCVNAIRDFMQFTAAIVWRPHIDGNPPTLPRCGCTEAVGVHEAASASTCHFFGQHCEQ